MLMLGDVLALAQRRMVISRWLEAANPALASAVRDAAALAGETPEQFTRFAVVSFTSDADPEAWATLTTRLREAEDPGMACISEMIRWRLAAERDFKPSHSA